MINVLRRILPNFVKIRLVQLYHCALLVKICDNWPVAVLDRLQFIFRKDASKDFLLRLRNGLSLQLQLGTFDVQMAAEIVGEKVYTPRHIVNKFGAVDIVLDIGANKGIFTVFASKQFPNAVIYSYEPDPDIFAQLKSNVVLNKLEGRCVLYNAAVWCDTASVSFLRSASDNAGTGRIVEGDKKPLNAVEVPAVGFSDLLDKLGNVDFAKMDVEGGEYRIILDTAPEYLKRVKCLALEWHRVPGHHVSELVERLYAIGFTLAFGSRGNMLYALRR